MIRFTLRALGSKPQAEHQQPGAAASSYRKPMLVAASFRKPTMVIGLLVTASVLGGCAPEPLPTLMPPVVATPSPVLNQDQTDNVLGQISTALASATDSRNPELLADRLTGPALAVRTSQLQVAGILDSNEQVTVIPDAFQQIIVSTEENWPRTLFAITTATEQLQPPRLLALEQVSAREPYRLWGWVQLQAGVFMPAFADPRVGSEQVDPADGEGTLVMSPDEAIRQYADLLVHGENSEYLGNFEPLQDDQFRAFMANWQAAQATALQGERIEGTYEFSAHPAEGSPVRAIRSADGGAMVMGEIRSSERLQALEGAVLAPQTLTAQALLYGQEFANVLTADYIDMIALYIPAAGSGERVRFLGYSHIQTGASVGGEEEAAEEPTEPTE